jgi:hypothetical protein
MKRWHEEFTITRREWKKHWRIHVESNQDRSVGYGPGRREPGSDPRVVDCPCDAQVGRFRKRDAYDCGRPGCLICHRDKFPRRTPTDQERIGELRFQEQLQELRELGKFSSLRRIV